MKEAENILLEQGFEKLGKHYSTEQIEWLIENKPTYNILMFSKEISGLKVNVFLKQEEDKVLFNVVVLGNTFNCNSESDVFTQSNLDASLYNTISDYKTKSLMWGVK